MKKYLLIALSFLLLSYAFAEIYTIGMNYDVQNLVPVQGFYEYSWSKIIYTATELDDAGVPAGQIDALGFDVYGNPGDFILDPIKVYMRHTSAAEVDATYPDNTQFQEVYDAPFTCSSSGWHYFMFANPFIWDGESNIEILFEDHTGTSAYGGPGFWSHYTYPDNLVAYNYSYELFPTDDGIIEGLRPNIQIVTPMTNPPEPTTVVRPVNGATYVSSDLTLQWNGVFGADGYKLYLSTDAIPTYVGDMGSQTSYSPVDLQHETQYYWQVVPYNSNGDAVNCPIWSFSTSPAGTIVIGEGTSVSRFPLGTYRKYERSAALYTSAEIGTGNKRINTLGWFATRNANQQVPTKIYLKTSPSTTITSATWADFIAGATLVYNGTDTAITANNWHLIELDDTFDLDNGDNLLVLVERNREGTSSSGLAGPGIHATSMSDMHHILQDANNPPAGTSNSQTLRPNLMFFSTSYEATHPPNPAISATPTNGAYMVSRDAQLSWTSGGGGPSGYKLYFGDSNPPAFVADLGDVTTHDPGTLDFSTTYYWQIVPYNSAGDAESCPIWYFTVMDDPTQILPWSEDFTGVPAGFIPEGWSRTDDNWYVRNTDFAGGTEPELRVFWDPYVSGIQRVITPPFLGDNEGGYTLEFKHYLEYMWTPSTIKVEYSTDLNTWDTLWSQTVNEDNIGPETISLTLPDDIIDAHFYLSWAFDGHSNNNNLWYLDDIAIIPIIVGPAAAPLLAYPANGASDMPIEGFELSWEPDMYNGGAPDYYVVFLSQDEDDIFDSDYFETSNAFFNPATEGGITLDNNERWFWAVEAQNSFGGNVSAIHSFTTIAVPPQISVNPGSFTENLEVTETSAQALTITNDGGLPLHYSFKFTEAESRREYEPVIRDLLPNPNASLYAERYPQAGDKIQGSSRAYLDLQFVYPNADADGEYGVVTDGEYIYTSHWSGSGSQRFFKYSLDGDYLGSFVIPGFDSVRDMTFDGTYIYGANTTNTVYKMDFNTQSLVETITVPADARGIAYDPDENGLWITDNWLAPLRLVGFDGTLIRTLETDASAFAGIAYDDLSVEGTIWANTQNGDYESDLLQIDKNTGEILTVINITPDMIPGMGSDPMAGGIDITFGIIPGYATLIANIQNELMYGMELFPIATWAKADPRFGVVPAGSSAQVDIIFDANDIAPGSYNGEFTVLHNALEAPVIIPASLTITGEWLPEYSINLESWDFGEVEQLNPASKQFTIRNIGGPGLNFTAEDIYIADDAEGNFQIQANLPVELDYYQTFSFNVLFTPQTLGAKTGSLKIQDGLGRVLHTYSLSGIGIEEDLGQVVHLEANVQDYTDVLLTWGVVSSTPGSPGWLHYDNGINYEAMGTGREANFDVAIKYTSLDLWNYEGMQIEKVKFFPCSENTNYTLNIWTGDDEPLAPNTLMYSQPITDFTVNTWNEVVLDIPFPIVRDEAIWIGYNCDVYEGAQYYPAGCDAGPAVVGKSDILYIFRNWYSATSLYELNVNWNLQAYVNDASAPTRGGWLNTPVVTDAENMEDGNIPFFGKSGTATAQQRVPRGFNIFRNNVQINTELVPSPIYLDTDLQSGTYTYTVQVVNHSQVSEMSDPVTVVIDAPLPLSLPFIEEWDSGDFEANTWVVDGANWSISNYQGNPPPTALFSLFPSAFNYTQTLTSYKIDATDIDAMYLSFDLYLSYATEMADNTLYAEVWDGTQWQHLGGYNASNGDLPWTTFAYDITPYAANRIFKIRFVSAGASTFEIDYWYLDNIKVVPLITSLDPVTDLAIEKTSTGVTLSWTENPDAEWYIIYVSDDPHGTYQELGYVNAVGSVQIPAHQLNADRQFFRISAGVTPFTETRNLLNLQTK